ncbi:MAG: tetratricopeptide repeat protein [Ferruginibacter sp.]|nr:tetratricopeptide repeat protein [Ferruginibacter sp.]
MKGSILVLFMVCFSIVGFSQATHVITDSEKQYKEARDLFVKEQYALAYPLVKELLDKYPANMASEHSYLREDVWYYEVVCRLKLMQELATGDAVQYINSVSNEPRIQLMSFHLAHYYFLKGEYSSAIQYYGYAGVDNLTNAQVADAKFELAYSYFNLKQFNEAKPLFAEIIQLPGNKYFTAANYYYGFIAYSDKDYNTALKSFKSVESVEPYNEVVPYYIAEIYYFQGNKEEAKKYGTEILNSGDNLYYGNRMKLLIGQLDYEAQNYSAALPLLDDYVNSADKVSKEVMYEYSFAHYKVGDMEKAIEGFKQLSGEKDSMGQNSMYLLGSLYLKKGDKANARSAFQYCANNSSNETQQQIARFNYAKLSYELGYQDVALSEMRQFIADYPKSEYRDEANEILLNILSHTSNFREAMEIYRGIAKPTPGMERIFADIMYGRAIELINDQQLAQADVLMADVISNSYSNNLRPYAQFWRGEIAFRQQRYADALRFTRAFLSANVPGQGEANINAARYNLGYSSLYLDLYEDAFDYFKAIAAQVSSRSSALEQDAYLRSGDALYMMRNYTKANTVYDAFINQSLPQLEYALFQKARIAGIYNSQEKIKLMSRITAQNPSSSLAQEANMEIAHTYLADERPKDALPYFDKVLVSSNEGLKPQAYLQSALAHYNSGNNKEALNLYETLIKKYPHSTEAREALQSAKDILIESGRPQDFVKLSKSVGYDVSDTEADSLAFVSAELRFNNEDYSAAEPALQNYLINYPNGTFVLDATYMRSVCLVKKGDFINALKGFAFVSDKGFSKYYEDATMEAGRLAYFETKQYGEAKKYFERLRVNGISEGARLEALRGLTRSYYQLKSFDEANSAARELLSEKGITTDDKSIANLVLGKSLQVNKDWDGAINAFKSVIVINRSGWGAEARYELAVCYFIRGNLSQAEKSANAVIKETGSYDYWVTSAYILLGDIFMEQKDYFNAKATYESVAQNAVISDLKQKAAQKYDAAVLAEKKQSKINN